MQKAQEPEDLVNVPASTIGSLTNMPKIEATFKSQKVKRREPIWKLILLLIREVNDITFSLRLVRRQKKSECRRGLHL